MKATLYIGNRNYSSWSLRAWLALEWSGIDFSTRVVAFAGPGSADEGDPGICAISPSGTVPALHLGEDVVCDSLAIAEWAAEQNIELWPRDPLARAMARSATCEMHSGFSAMRKTLVFNARRRAGPRSLDARVERDLRRLFSIWGTLRSRFGSEGSYLFGARPGIADAFFAPVASRIRTYAVPTPAAVTDYVDALLGHPSVVAWDSEAALEPWVIPESDRA